MKKINILIYFLNTLLLVMIPSILINESHNLKDTKVKVNLLKKELNTSFVNHKSEIAMKVVEEKDEENTEEENKEEVNEQTTNKKIENKASNTSENSGTNNVVETKQEQVAQPAPVNTNETLVGSMSGYGPDCRGCSGYLSSGLYVGDGTIYYNDKQYGNIRIVAGDYKYKLGSIVKISNSNVGGPFLAIVLDRGGSVGINKKFTFDLLYKTSEEALRNEVSRNTTFEILRNGY